MPVKANIFPEKTGPWQQNFVDARFLQSHMSDRQELHNNNWASWTLHLGSSESSEPPSNYLLHTVRLSMCPDMPLCGSNSRGAKYAVYYASVVMHTVFKNIKWLHSALCQNKKSPVASINYMNAHCAYCTSIAQCSALSACIKCFYLELICYFRNFVEFVAKLPDVHARLYVIWWGSYWDLGVKLTSKVCIGLQ